uniref:Uncharacterized protein n=1 Tax=Glossina pallidipes TaxID=7398 RepID=A0A1A9ZN70_GLOPL
MCYRQFGFVVKIKVRHLHIIKIIMLPLKIISLIPLYGSASSYELGPPTKTLYTIVMRFLMLVIPVYSFYNLYLINSMEASNEPEWIDSSLNFLNYIITISFCTRHYQLLEKIINGLLKFYEEMKEYGKCVDVTEARFSITCTIIMLTLQCCVANLFPQTLARIHIAEKANQNIVDNFLTSCIRQPVQFTGRGFFTITNRTLFNKSDIESQNVMKTLQIGNKNCTYLLYLGGALAVASFVK